MKKFIVKKNSWHYRMNMKMVQNNDYISQTWQAEKYIKSKNTFCSYWQLTLISLSKIIISLSFVAFMVAFVAGLCYLLVNIFMADPITFLVTAGIILGSVLLIFLFGYIDITLDRRKRERINSILEDGETSLTKAKYSSWKNGICVPVEFKE